MTAATVAERNSTAYQSGRLLYLQKRVVELRAAGMTYKRLRALFNVSTATLCKWVRAAQR
jgi:transposase